MKVGTLVRKTSNGLLGVIVKRCHGDHISKDFWVEVLYYDESIRGCWTVELEAL